MSLSRNVTLGCLSCYFEFIYTSYLVPLESESGEEVSNHLFKILRIELGSLNREWWSVEGSTMLYPDRNE